MATLGQHSLECDADKVLGSLPDTSKGAAPPFLITVDTECDDAWSPTKPVSTANAGFLPRFQALCESFGLQPTYLTTFEMAVSPEFREFGQDLLKRGKGEIGMHLHAWNSLPLVPLTADDARFHPYLTEYPEPVMRDKINFLTDLLEDTFGTKMTSHRGGRWAFDQTYARLLVERGYLADCSVTPLISWAHHSGDPGQRGGPNFSQFPLLPYFVDLDDISRPGKSSLLEIPVTVMEIQPAALRAVQRKIDRRSLLGRIVNRFFPPVCWLAPTTENSGRRLRMVKRCLATNRPCVQLALHSSYLMPGGSPFFQAERDVEALYDHLNELFSIASENFRGSTVTDFRNQFAEA